MIAASKTSQFSRPHETRQPDATGKVSGGVHGLPTPEVEAMASQTAEGVYACLCEQNFDAARGAIDRMERKRQFEIAKLTKSSRPLDAGLAEAGVSVRTTNSLEQAGIYTVEHALAMTPEEMLGLQNMGPLGIEEVRSRCEAWLDRPAKVARSVA